MIPVPANFDGEKFMEKYGLSPTDFKVINGMLVCPSLPDLTAADLADCVVDMARFDRIQARLAAAREAIKLHPWAGWTQSQLLTWWNANLSDSLVDALSIPAGAKTMLKASNGAILKEAQFLIYLRDLLFPELPEG